MTKLPPCIRGLATFKKGCPQKHWDGKDGCPAWKEYTLQNSKPDEPPVLIKGCIDVLSEVWQFRALGLLEGNQQATESFRNGMCEVVDGKSYPKMDRAVLGLVSMMQREKEDRRLVEKKSAVPEISNSTL